MVIYYQLIKINKNTPQTSTTTTTTALTSTLTQQPWKKRGNNNMHGVYYLREGAQACDVYGQGKAVISSVAEEIRVLEFQCERKQV